MYRYSVDDAVTYTSEDFVLFRESPFACWMERLTLENPDHGIPPDVGSVPPRDSIEPQDDMADTLRSEGKEVRLIDWDMDEPERRRSTLDAMRQGADFIVNGQLALGPLSGAANLLMRTSGFSELGDFLYIPCDTQPKSNEHSAFRLSFLADLLHSLQGQLPPQMLVIRGGEDLIPLQTESHIYHYRAVKQRFMETMRSFRKHRMPDPAESTHFGRWSDCAHEVLKQRLLREEEISEEITDEDYVKPLLQAAGGSAVSDAVAEGEQTAGQLSPAAPSAAVTPRLDPGTDSGGGSGFTLAEQAHMLSPDTYKPGPGVYRLGPPRTVASSVSRPEATEPVESAGPQSDNISAAAATSAKPQRKYNRRASDKALQNLEFIGSNPRAAALGLDTAPALDTSPVPPAELAPETASETDSANSSTAPAPSLRDPRTFAAGRAGEWTGSQETRSPGHAEIADEPVAHDPVADEPVADEPVARDTLQEFRSPAAPPAFDSDGVDRDATHLVSPPAGLTTSEGLSDDDLGIQEHPVEHRFGQAAGEGAAPRQALEDSPSRDRPRPEKESAAREFSSSLITSDEYED